MTHIKIVATFLLGVLWFASLSVSEGLRSSLFREITAAGVLPAVVLAVAVSAAAAYVLLRGGRSVRTAVVSGLVMCLIAGLVIGRFEVAAVQPVGLSAADLLARGASGISAWVALAVAGVIAAAPVGKKRQDAATRRRNDAPSHVR